MHPAHKDALKSQMQSHSTCSKDSELRTLQENGQHTGQKICHPLAQLFQSGNTCAVCKPWRENKAVEYFARGFIDNLFILLLEMHLDQVNKHLICLQR